MSASATLLNARALAVILLLGGVAAPAASQTVSVKATGDSVSWPVRRARPESADALLYTRDRQVVLLVADTALILQFTDAGIDGIRKEIEADTTKGFGGRVLMKMFGAGISELFEYGFAYRLSALGGANVDGNRLVIEDREGNRVFRNVEVNGRQVMDDFSPAEAERFAAVINAAIRRQRPPVERW